jgi:hypothetical protein
MENILTALEIIQKNLKSIALNPMMYGNSLLQETQTICDQAVKSAESKALNLNVNILSPQTREQLLEMFENSQEVIALEVRKALTDFIGKPIPVSHAAIERMHNTVDNFIGIVDRGPMKDWRSNRGERLKDTQEYVDLYLLNSQLRDIILRKASDFEEKRNVPTE